MNNKKMDNITFEKMENEIRSMFTKDTGNSTDNKYNIYKLKHSEFVSKIALLIYKNVCKEKAKKCDNNVMHLIHISALLHDTGKIRVKDGETIHKLVDNKISNLIKLTADTITGEIPHAILSANIAEKFLINFKITKEEKEIIVLSIINHSEKEDIKTINKLSYIARFILEADLITKTYINDILSWYDNTIDLYNNLEYISSTVNKKYIKRRKILSNSGRKIGDKIEKDFNKFFVMAIKQRNLIEKR